MKKNVFYLSQQTKFLGSLGVLAMMAILQIPSSCKSETSANYNGAAIFLPEDIDCAKAGDTLYVLNVTRLGQNRREIQIGYGLDSIEINKRFNHKN